MKNQQTQRETIEKNKTKLAKSLEQEKRDEGLENEIPSDNKGFEILTKMGFKKGQSIGKSSNGILKPLNFTIKCGRHGLGRKLDIAEVQSKPKNIKQPIPGRRSVQRKRSKLRKQVEGVKTSHAEGSQPQIVATTSNQVIINGVSDLVTSKKISFKEYHLKMAFVDENNEDGLTGTFEVTLEQR